VFRVVLVIALATPLVILNTRIVQADTEVGGPIISDTTWTAANSPYIVVESVEVWEDVTLTVEPGVTVKFDAEKKLQVSGELIGQGTENNPVTFTSNRADPAPGDWGNIEFTTTAVTTTMDSEGNYISGSILQYSVVEYAGHDAYSAVAAHSLLIDHCTVRDNDARGIDNPGTETASSRVTNNTVSRNSGDPYHSRGVYGGGIYARYSELNGNTISDNSGGYGGGIYAQYSELNGNTISGNSSCHGGGLYASYSTVSDNIVSGNSATYCHRGVYGGGIYAQYSELNGNTISDNRATGSFPTYYYATVYGGGVYAQGGKVSDNRVTGNSATGHGDDAAADVYGGGIYADGGTVSGNTVSGNSAAGLAPSDWGAGYGGGIYADGGTVSGNTVSGNSAAALTPACFGVGYCGVSDAEEVYGGGICASSSTVLSNTISTNSVSGGYNARGAGAYVFGSNDFLYNTLVGNSGPARSMVGGLEIDGRPQVHYNNLYGNKPYDVTVVSSDDISGTHNYWGTVSSVDILSQVYDWHDDSTRGKFLYVPYLQDPSEDAPFPPPTGLTADFQDDVAALSWDAHPSFTTGYGYKVHYDTDSSVPPYEGTGLNEGDAPIDVGDQTAYTLSGLDPSKDYYVTVTAYDNEGHESWYSNVVWKQGGYWVYLPLVLRR
jgi:hypothetical protein